MKQKSIEQFLGVHREDKYNGGQLIDVYREYLHTHEKFLFDLLILHNAMTCGECLPSCPF